MHKAYTMWTTWSIALFIVWAVIFLVIWKLKKPINIKTLAIYFAGYFIGWFSATIKFVLIIHKIY